MHRPHAGKGQRRHRPRHLSTQLPEDRVGRGLGPHRLDGLVRGLGQIVHQRAHRRPPCLRIPRRGLGVEELDNLQGHAEHPRPQHLQLDVGRDVYAGGPARRVDRREGSPELAADGAPFSGREVVVLIEEH